MILVANMVMEAILNMADTENTAHKIAILFSMRITTNYIMWNGD